VSARVREDARLGSTNPSQSNNLPAAGVNGPTLRAKVDVDCPKPFAYFLQMIIGVPKEIKTEENRVAVTPTGVAAFVARGHKTLVQRGAGVGSGFTDRAYEAAGAILAANGAEVWTEAELIMKVKEPQASEFVFLRPGLILFTYLHLAANESVTRMLLEKKVTAIAYETIQLEDGTLPLLAPMSEIAGRLSLQVGAWCLQAENGGRGILLGGASGVRPGKVVILGAGMSGTAACQVAAGMGAYVSILDINPTKLRYVHDILGGHVTTLMSNRANVEEEAVDADLIIGSVLIPGAQAPKLITRSLVRRMRPGAALVDISIDQGGCAETSRPTTHREPIYLEENVVHYCVTNMPAIVPNTSTYALTNSTLSYGLQLANRGFPQALTRDTALRKGLNTFDGKVTHEGVAGAFNLPLIPIEEVIGT
jgi:alanine dehydrogenase